MFSCGLVTNESSRYCTLCSFNAFSCERALKSDRPLIVDTCCSTTSSPYVPCSRCPGYHKIHSSSAVFTICSDYIKNQFRSSKYSCLVSLQLCNCNRTCLIPLLQTVPDSLTAVMDTRTLLPSAHFGGSREATCRWNTCNALRVTPSHVIT